MVISTRRWTIAEWERLPHDGNRYEVVAGELFVTPMPMPGHQIVVQRLWEGRSCPMITDVLRWHPAGAGEPLEIELSTIFP